MIPPIGDQWPVIANPSADARRLVQIIEWEARSSEPNTAYKRDTSNRRLEVAITQMLMYLSGLEQAWRLQHQMPRGPMEGMLMEWASSATMQMLDVSQDEMDRLRLSHVPGAPNEDPLTMTVEDLERLLDEDDPLL